MSDDKTFFLGSEQDRLNAIEFLKNLDITEAPSIRLDIQFQDLEKNPKRTLLQNASYWKWLTLLSEGLNDAGFDLTDKVVIKVPVSFTKDNLHENTCKPVMKALWPQIHSTGKLSTVQMSRLYNEVDMVIAQRTGVHVPWPEEEKI